MLRLSGARAVCDPSWHIDCRTDSNKQWNLLLLHAV